MAFRQLRDQLRAQASEAVGRAAFSPPFGSREKFCKVISMSVEARTGAAIACIRAKAPRPDRPHEEFGLRRRVGIEHHGDPGEIWCNLFEQVNPFPADRKLERAEAGEIASRLGDAATKPCSTGSETPTNTIGTVSVACWTTVRLVVEKPRARIDTDYRQAKSLELGP